MLQHEKADATSKAKAATLAKNSSKAVQNAAMEAPAVRDPSFTSFVLPSAFRALAENGVMQGKETAATLGGAAEETYSVSVKNLDAYGLKIMEAGRSNVHAAFDCCRELVAAQSHSELMEIWNAHARRQFDAMITQNREIWSLAWKVAADAPQPIAAGISQTFARSG